MVWYPSHFVFRPELLIWRSFTLLRETKPAFQGTINNWSPQILLIHEDNSTGDSKLKFKSDKFSRIAMKSDCICTHSWHIACPYSLLY